MEGEEGQGRGGPPQGPQIQTDGRCHDVMEEAPIQQGVVREKEEGRHCYSGAAPIGSLISSPMQSHFRGYWLRRRLREIMESASYEESDEEDMEYDPP